MKNDDSSDKNAIKNSNEIILSSGLETLFDGRTIRFVKPANPSENESEADKIENNESQKSDDEKKNRNNIQTEEISLNFNSETSQTSENRNDKNNKEVSFDFEYFSNHFSKNQDSDKNNDKAFEVGLQSVFQFENEEFESDSNDLSESEIFQKEEKEFQDENIEAVIKQNDADSLYRLGEKYEHTEITFQDHLRKTIVDPQSILEAMLFVGNRENRPLSLTQATELMRNVSELEAIEALHDLNERYYKNESPYHIIREQDGFRMALRPEMSSIQERFGGKIREFKLSQRAIDVLALIAYRQPISFSEIQEVRSNSGSILTLLTKRDLISQEKKTVAGKKIVYFSTTKRFLKLFNIESLDDLPIVEEIDFR
ncbi:MAG: SMC-Scp complex subunit ScpB [Planctomycetia bacterium]|nr:SMC-Scp complex subunit ScpB [Planctomycetia bacterium]